MKRRLMNNMIAAKDLTAFSIYGCVQKGMDYTGLGEHFRAVAFAVFIFQNIFFSTPWSQGIIFFHAATDAQTYPTSNKQATKCPLLGQADKGTRPFTLPPSIPAQYQPVAPRRAGQNW